MKLPFLKSKTESADLGENFENSVNTTYENEKNKNIKNILITVSVILSVIILSSVVSLVKNAWEIHMYVGIVVLILLIILISFFVIVPMLKLFALKPLSIKVSKEAIPLATKENIRILKKSARNIIKYHNKSNSVKYISKERLLELEKVLEMDAKSFSEFMGDLYNKEIAEKVGVIINNSASRAFLTTAISQNEQIDMLSALFINISMTKQIVFAYGFRPTTSELLKIFIISLENSIAAFCMENTNFFSGVTNKLIKGVTEWLPLINTVVDSTFQGATNALLASLLGRKVKRVLFGEYTQANSLIDANNNDIDDDMEEAISEVKNMKQKSK